MHCVNILRCTVRKLCETKNASPVFELAKRVRYLLKDSK